MTDAGSHGSGRDTRHQELREALASYLIGGLDRTERIRVAEHLDSCAACRRELAELAAVPGLLAQLSGEEAVAGLPVSPEAPLHRATAQLARERRSIRTRLMAWRVLGVAATLALTAVLAVPLIGGPAGTEFHPRPVSGDAAAVEGTALVQSEPWGMVVELSVRDLPERRGYTLWAVENAEHRAQVGSWAATEDRRIDLVGTCYMDLEAVERLEVRTPDDELLFALEGEDRRARG